MIATVQFGKADQNFGLVSAVLIYKSEGQYAATVHDIQTDDKRPRLKPGKPITMSAIEELMRALGKQSEASYVPEPVVSLGIDRMAWWCPAGRRRIWFKPSHADKADAANLKKLNGKFVHHPPLLFVARHNLTAFALGENKRPTLESKLYVAPYWNLSGDGAMCRGNIKLPVATTDSLAQFERAFFNSAFTHSSAGRITSHKGGHAGLWKDLAQRTEAPTDKWWQGVLIPSKKTIGNLFK